MSTESAPLRRLLSRPLFRRWAVANLFARLPLTMNLLALVLVGEEVTGSLATGAMLAGIATATSGLTAQWRGRQLDRTELRGGLRRDLLVTAVVVGVLAVAAQVGAPVWVLGIIVAVEGLAFAAVLGAFRTLLVKCVPPRDIEPANAIDAVFVEVAFVAGPALAGALALVVGPIGVLGLMVLAFVVASLMLSWLPTREPVAGGLLPGPSPLRTRGATPVYALVFFAGLPLGAYEALVPARIEAFGLEPASAGPLLALTAFGSAVGGIIATNLRDPLRQGRLLGAALLGVFGLLFIPAAVAPNLWVLGATMVLFGLPIAPLNALAGLAFQRTVATPRQAEGFSLYPAMILIGAGLGQALAGLSQSHLTPGQMLGLLSLVPFGMALVLLGAALRRRRAGLPPGVGFGHDPTIADPDGYRSAPPVADVPAAVATSPAG